LAHEENPPPEITANESVDPNWHEVIELDIVSIELGFRLISLVDESQGAKLLKQMRGVRLQLSKQFGFVLPRFHMRDNLDLPPNDYQILVGGAVIGAGAIYPEQILALSNAQISTDLEGIKVTEPAFGLPAIWIEQEKSAYAQSLGYSLVDASSVLATHLHQVLSQNVAGLLGIDETNAWLEVLAQNQPKLAEQLVPQAISLPNLLLLLAALLKEQISIKDMRQIALTICTNANKNANAAALLAAVRIALARQIVQGLIGAKKELKALALSGELEHLLQNSISHNLLLEPNLAQNLSNLMHQACSEFAAQNLTPILLVADILRAHLAQFAQANCPKLQVLSFSEIPTEMTVNLVQQIG